MIQEVSPQSKSKPPTEAENIVEAVILLWELMTPADAIARRMRLDQATVLHVIEYGRLPARQLTLAWCDEPQAASIDGQVGR